MNQYYLATVAFAEFVDQPVVETAALEDGHKLGIHVDELLKEPLDLLRPCTDLASKQRVA